MTNVEKFFAHVYECDDFDDFCPTCRELMFEAVDELPEPWQYIARRLQEREGSD